MNRRLARTLLLAAAAAALAPRGASAFELADGRLDIGLSGEAGYGRTDGNTYVGGAEEGNYDNTLLALSVAGQLSPRLRVVGRVAVNEGGTAMVDWAFAEWKFADALRLRAGKAKHAFGNYGEIIEEGTLRPFFYAPQSIYGPANMVGEGYKGLGLTGFLRLGGWGLAYDVYGGDLDLETSNAIARIADPSLNPEEELLIFTSDMIGARLSLETPLDGLVFRASGYTGKEEENPAAEEGVRHTVGALSAEYLTEALALRAEYAYAVERATTTTNAAYVEVALKLAMGLQLAGRVEGSWTKLDGFTGSSPNLRHREAAVGLNYWFAPEFVLKAEYHLVDGNRFAYAPFEEGTLPSPIPEPSETTRLFFLGAQFAL
jgi:hypothetical protein